MRMHGDASEDEKNCAAEEPPQLSQQCVVTSLKRTEGNEGYERKKTPRIRERRNPERDAQLSRKRMGDIGEVGSVLQLTTLTKMSQAVAVPTAAIARPQRPRNVTQRQRQTASAP